MGCSFIKKPKKSCTIVPTRVYRIDDIVTNQETRQNEKLEPAVFHGFSRVLNENTIISMKQSSTNQFDNYQRISKANTDRLITSERVRILKQLSMPIYNNDETPRNNKVPKRIIEIDSTEVPK